METYSKGWQAIVKPRRTTYDFYSLGPTHQYVTQPPRLPSPELPNQVEIERIDFSIKNSKRKKIQCSFFRMKGDNNKLRPCVVYCHSHSSSRVEGLPIKNEFLPKFSFCVFDFTGCGQSEGEYVTLGAKEKDDIQAVLMSLKIDFGLQFFFLYGRSMGAASVMLYLYKYVNGTGFINANNSPSRGVLGVVLDSPFTKLKSLVNFFNFFIFQIFTIFQIF